MNLNPMSNMGISEVALSRLKVAVQSALSPSVAQSARFDVMQDIGERLVVQLRSYVLAEHLDSHTQTATETVKWEEPDGWREQWKQDHLDAYGWAIRWIARRKPVRMRSHQQQVRLSVTWDRYASFPESTIAMPDERLGAPVRLMTASRDVKWMRE